MGDQSSWTLRRRVRVFFRRLFCALDGHGGVVLVPGAGDQSYTYLCKRCGKRDIAP